MSILTSIKAKSGLWSMTHTCGLPAECSQASSDVDSSNLCACVQVPILVDGGLRRGSDVLKALALGADAVMVGRPIIYGLALNGQRGVEQVLEMLRAELELCMRLCGVPSIGDITPELVLPSISMVTPCTSGLAGGPQARL